MLVVSRPVVRLFSDMTDFVLFINLRSGSVFIRWSLGCCSPTSVSLRSVVVVLSAFDVVVLHSSSVLSSADAILLDDARVLSLMTRKTVKRLELVSHFRKNPQTNWSLSRLDDFIEFLQLFETISTSKLTNCKQKLC